MIWNEMNTNSEALILMEWEERCYWCGEPAEAIASVRGRVSEEMLPSFPIVSNLRIFETRKSGPYLLPGGDLPLCEHCSKVNASISGSKDPT